MKLLDFVISTNNLRYRFRFYYLTSAPYNGTECAVKRRLKSSKSVLSCHGQPGLFPGEPQHTVLKLFHNPESVNIR